MKTGNNDDRSEFHFSQKLQVNEWKTGRTYAIGRYPATTKIGLSSYALNDRGLADDVIALQTVVQSIHLYFVNCGGSCNLNRIIVCFVTALAVLTTAEARVSRAIKGSSSL